MNNYQQMPQSSCNYPGPQHDIFCWCSLKVIGFLATLLSATLGLIFGAIYWLAILISLPALIVLAVVLTVLIIVVVIFRWCKCKRHC